MSSSTPKMTDEEKEVAEAYASSLSDLTLNSKPLINVLTMLAHESITCAPIIVQAVERHLQQVPADMKLPVLYLIDSVVKNVGDTYTTLFTQNIVSTFCSVFEKVDERTRALMFKLRQTWNEVFPAKKLYAVDVRVNSIDPAWPITALPPTIHVNPKFFRQPATTVAQTTNATTTSTATATSVSTTSTVSTASATVTDDSQTLTEAKMREQLLKKQKELLELQQKKLELELLQTKARLEEQQKQLDRQLRPEIVPITNKKRGLHRSTEKSLSIPRKEKGEKKPFLSVIQSEAVKLIAKPVDTSSSGSAKAPKSATTSATAPKIVTTTVPTIVTVPEAVVTTTAAVSARASGSASGNSKLKSETSTVSVTKTVSTTSRPVTTPAVTTVTPSVRSRDPRLASRQIQPVPPVNNSAQQEDEEMQEPDTVFEAVKLETTKPKPQITINLGCVNKGTVNKESRGISKKDPRLISNKVHGISNSNIKGRTLSATGGGASSKGGGKVSSRGPSPSSLPAPSPLPSSPSRSSSSSSSGSSSGIGKTSTSPSPLSSTSQRKTQNKNISSNGNSKPARIKAIPKIIKIDLTDSPPPKIGEIKEENVDNKDKDNEAFSKISSPFKGENHKKKSSPVGSSRSSSSSSASSTSPAPDRKKGLSKTVNESLSMGGNNSNFNDKRERGKSSSGGDKRHNRERAEREHIASTKFNMFVESEGESPSPPPPPVISENKKREEPSSTKTSAFKDVKVSTKSRNYVRRNRRSKSRSPEISPVITTGDVDLRVGGPPEKHPRLNVFQPDTIVSTATTEEEIKKPLVEAANKDVDLRQLPGSPSKKRASMERAEQPPPKKSKAEVFDELFGNEDVDLRQLPPGVALVKQQATIPLSPPPPPIISQPSPIPTSTSSQDSSVNTISSPKRSSPEREKEETEAHTDETKPMEDDSKENNDSGLKSKGWAKFKETYKSPLRRLVSFHDEIELPKSQSSTPGSDSPLRERDIIFGTPRGMTHFHRSSGNFDKLGRPRLYHRLPDDPGERRRSLSTPGGEDTDMRRPLLEDADESDINVDMIMHQADEQLKNGTISFTLYNTLLKQVIQLNEVQKLREAQRRDQQENKENWERSRKKRVTVGITSEPGQLSPVSADDESQDCSSIDTRFGDIDERFPAAHKLRNPVPVPPSVPSPPEPSIPASGKFPSGPTHWNDMNHPHVGSGRWEPSPNPWLRGGPGPGPASVPSAPISSGILAGPHIRILNQGQSATFHRPPGPEFQQMNNFGGMGRWRAPQFQARQPFESEVDRFEPRFSGMIDNRFRIAAPVVQEHVPRPNSDELPPADPMLLDLIAQDTMRTINIDAVPREIRFYGDVAVVLLAWDDPREIGFQGGTRRIIFDERDSIICTFNDTYREFIIDGSPHRIRLGAPTRELYIDDKWYEACFGGPPITIEIGGKMHSVKLEGPPPQVKIGFEKRLDLVAGKINLIINARNMVPVFLDAKPQRFDIEGKPHVLRFVEALSTVLINGQPIKVEFGGLPKPIIVRGKKHFIRFTVLPRGIKPGYVTIVNMEGGRLPSPPRSENENSNSAGFQSSAATTAAEEDSNEGKFQRGHDPVLPVLGGASNTARVVRGLRRGFGSDRDSPQEAEHSRNSPAQFLGDNAVMGPVIPLQQQTRPRQQGQVPLPLEMLTSLMPTVMAPATGFGYQVEQDSQDGQPRPAEIQVPAPVPVGVSESSLPSAGGSVTIPFLRTEINVDELFQKLVATGIVPQAEKNEADNKKEEEVKSIKPVDFKLPETLKVRQPGVVTVLYSGIQCSSCGVRFPPEQTMKYSQHLDWHFRQNRRDRDNTRKAQSRKWYYDVSDWIQFEEIEDLEERAQSWFETQQATGEEEKEVQEIPSVCAGENPEDTFCDVCHDKFEQFYNEEREEWHLRKAVRVDGKTYHPLCYEDYKASLEVSVEEPSVIEEPKEGDAVKKEDENESGQEAKKEDEAKAEETPVEVKTEAMDTSEPVEAVKEEVTDEDKKTEEIETEIKVELIETELKEVNLEPVSDEKNTKENEMSTEINAEVKVEPEGKIPEESIAEEEIEPITTADTTHAAVACSIDGNVQFEESSQLASAGPIPGKIKINIMKSLPATSKEPQSEGDTEIVADQNVDSESCPVITEASRESGEEGIGEEEVDSGEPPPPGVEPVQLKPRLVGRKLTELPPVMKGTELSGLCSIM